MFFSLGSLPHSMAIQYVWIHDKCKVAIGMVGISGFVNTVEPLITDYGSYSLFQFKFPVFPV